MDDLKQNASVDAELPVQQSRMNSPSGVLTKSAQRRAREKAKQRNSGDNDSNEVKNSDDSRNCLRTREGL